jgi:hypothetical protein
MESHQKPQVTAKEGLNCGSGSNKEYESHQVNPLIDHSRLVTKNDDRCQD